MKYFVKVPELLLPKKEIDLKKWTIVACDQYTSEPEYWKKVKSDFYPRNVNDEMYGGGFDIWQKEQKNIWGRGKHPTYIHSMYRFTRKTRKPVRKTRKTRKSVRKTRKSVRKTRKSVRKTRKTKK